VQAAVGFDWGPLHALQREFWYRIATGSLLALFIAAQWFLALCRYQRWNHLAKRVYSWHQRIGIGAPVFLFLHSVRLGFGYLAVLTVAYLATNALGMLSPQAIVPLRKYQTPWMVSHIALSILVAALAAYHSWTALYFE
jgi:hypothetical protein